MALRQTHLLWSICALTGALHLNCLRTLFTKVAGTLSGTHVMQTNSILVQSFRKTYPLIHGTTRLDSFKNLLLFYIWCRVGWYSVGHQAPAAHSRTGFPGQLAWLDCLPCGGRVPFLLFFRARVLCALLFHNTCT